MSERAAEVVKAFWHLIRTNDFRSVDSVLGDEPYARMAAMLLELVRKMHRSPGIRFCETLRDEHGPRGL
jgi:hypothetical protein